MKIYRVINKDGAGFYQSWSDTPPVQYWYPLLRNCDSKTKGRFISAVHPYLRSDCFEEHELFAFSSIDDLRKWFPDSILHVMNGNIIEIEIDSEYVKEYEGQCVYDPKYVKSTIVIDKTQFYKDWSFPSDDMWMWK